MRNRGLTALFACVLMLCLALNGAALAENILSDEQLVRSADVTVRYVDENGNDIADSAVLTLQPGAYRVTPKTGARGVPLITT